MIRFIALVVGSLLLVDSAIAVPTPVHAFDFDGDYVDSITGTVTIMAEGGAIVDSRHEMDPQVPPGDNNHGLTLTNPGLSDPGVYSIEMYVRYDAVRSIVDEHWIKLIDFKDGSIPWGMYYVDMAFTTRFDAIPADPGVASSINMVIPGAPPVSHTSGQPVMHAGEWNHLVVTRNASDEFAIYVDGQLDSSFVDDMDFGVFSETNAIMRFLQNDPVDDSFDYYNTAAGAIEFLNVYDQALSSSNVASLAAAVPEPTTVALVIGLSLVATRLRVHRNA